MTQPPPVVCSGIDFTRAERDLILAALFELTIPYVEDDVKRERSKLLAARFGGDPDAMFFAPAPEARP